MTIKSLLKNLADAEQPVKFSGLVQLSDLTSEELIEFLVGWSSVPTAKAREIIVKLIELCEENLELDFSVVFKAFLDDPDEEVRENAARGLWEFDDRSIIRPLVMCLQHDTSPRVRSAAASSLRKFANMAQIGKLLSRDANRIRDALLTVIGRKDEDLEVRRRAIEAVASFDALEIDGIIQEAYESDVPKLKQSSIYAMGQSSKLRWLPIVLEEMRNPLPEIRYEAAGACGLLGEESTVPHLIRLLVDEDTQVQIAAVRSLGLIGDTLATEALRKCLTLGEPALEEAATDALREIDFQDDPLGIRFHA